jgi:hypothetical protein
LRFEVQTESSAAEAAQVKGVADQRCLAIWAMDHEVPHTREVRKI